jgi:hypothetical protein
MTLKTGYKFNLNLRWIRQNPGVCFLQTWIQCLFVMFHHSLAGGLEHVLFSPRVGMMIQSDFHIFSGGRHTTNQFISPVCWVPHGCLASTSRMSRSAFQPPAGRHKGEWGRCQILCFPRALGECWLMLMVCLICFWNQDFLDASIIYVACVVFIPLLQGDLLRARVRPVDRQGTCRWRDRLDLSRDSRIAWWHCRGSLWKWRSNASHLVNLAVGSPFWFMCQYLFNGDLLEGDSSATLEHQRVNRKQRQAREMSFLFFGGLQECWNGKTMQNIT